MDSSGKKCKSCGCGWDEHIHIGYIQVATKQTFNDSRTEEELVKETDALRLKQQLLEELEQLLAEYLQVLVAIAHEHAFRTVLALPCLDFKFCASSTLKPTANSEISTRETILTGLAKQGEVAGQRGFNRCEKGTGSKDRFAGITQFMDSPLAEVAYTDKLVTGAADYAEGQHPVCGLPKGKRHSALQRRLRSVCPGLHRQRGDVHPS